MHSLKENGNGWYKIRLSAEDMSRFFIYFVSPYVTGNH